MDRKYPSQYYLVKMKLNYGRFITFEDWYNPDLNEIDEQDLLIERAGEDLKSIMDEVKVGFIDNIISYRDEKFTSRKLFAKYLSNIWKEKEHPDGNIPIETYRAIAVRCYGESIAKPLFDYWNTINELFYKGELPAPLITFEELPRGSHISGHLKLYVYQKKIVPCINALSIGNLVRSNIAYARRYIDDVPVFFEPRYWEKEIIRIHKIITGEELKEREDEGEAMNWLMDPDERGMNQFFKERKERDLNAYPIKFVNGIGDWPWPSSKVTIDKIFIYLTNNLKSLPWSPF